MHDRGVDVEAREAPHAADREEDRDDDTEEAVVMQHKGPGEEGRRDAEGAEVAERVHLLAHLAGHAEEAGCAAVKAIRDEREQNKDRTPDEVPTVRGKDRTHAEDEVR